MRMFAKRLLIAAACCGFLFSAACGGGHEGADDAVGDQAGGTETTETGAGGLQPTIENLVLIRPDGAELALSSRPIPRRVAIKASLSHAIANAADRAAVEASFSLRGPEGDALAGAFAWAADFLSLTFTPVAKLDHATTYALTVDANALPTLNLSKASTGATAFTTMSIGDVNGDGYSDALVAADSAPGGTGPGRAYLFHGSASGIPDKDLSAASANAIISGAAANDGLGYSLASAGDVNGDGYADIVVGALGADAGGNDRGMAYVFLGSASGIADCNLAAGCTAHASIAGITDSSEFGYSVNSAGDVNGDGYDDVIVGAYYDDVSPVVEPGIAYVFFGGPSLSGDLNADGDADVILTGDAHGDYFGWSVASAGDVNADGFDDVIVAANGIAPYYVSIFHGGPGFTGNLKPAADAATRLVGPGGFDAFGRSVNGAGDVNGDGFDDVIVGASMADIPGVTNAGSAYLYLGTANGVASCDLSANPGCQHATFTGYMTEGNLGSSVASAGDVNGDGFDDVLIGASHQGNMGQSFVYLFVGGASGIADCKINTTPGCPNARIGSVATHDWLGLSVNSAGDVDGDGFGDIILGAPVADGAGSNRGETYIFEGSTGGIPDCNLGVCAPATTFTGAANGDRLGFSVH